MNRKTRHALLFLSLLTIAALLLAACGGSTPTPAPATEAPAAEEEHEHAMEEHDVQEGEPMDEHMDEHAHSPEDHVGGMHGNIPEEFVNMPNPVPATEESIAKGAELYAANCAICHGENGEGDGPAASGLPKPPANLHEDHVQANSDGALFYIISHGVPDSPMPAWGDVLTEEERWHVVNFLRTFQEEQ